MTQLSETKTDSHPLLFNINSGKLVLFLMIAFPVVIDLLNGFITFFIGLDFSIGVLYRGLIFVCSLPVFILQKDKLWKLYLLIITGLWILSCIVWAGSGMLQLTKEFMLFIKMIYPFIILPMLFYIVKKYRIDIDYVISCSVSYCAIAGASIVFSLITGLGIEFSASKYSFGAKSFFVAQNDIGLSMLIGYTLSLYLFFKRFSFMYFFSTIMIMAGLIGLSTRTGIMGAIGVFIFLMFAIMFYSKKSVKIAYFTKVFIFSFFAVAVIAGTVKVIQLISEYEYMLTKFQALTYEHPRQNLTQAAYNRITGRHWIYNVFGEGMTHFKLEVGNRLIGAYDVSEEGQPVEVDYLDLMGNYGLIMTLVILIFPVLLFFKIFMNFILNRDFRDLIFLICISLFLVHSTLAGHAIISPLVATNMVVVYLYILHRKSFKAEQKSVVA
ncbi:MAG: hypothetical protein POELPBGB_02226 [Bacteroidia bacterium]|nr:hypothetical protein [Bacteroidia bacterium]